jgi:hypothetical protein
MNEETYTYQDYLEMWEDYHGDSSHGDFIYYHYGKQKTKRLAQMTRSQFIHARTEVDRLGPIIDQLQIRPDYGDNKKLDEQVDALMAESFDHELALFF